MSLKKRVAVIGAGICGLYAIKALKEEDLEPVCYERTGEYGGLWRYREEDIEGVPSVMKSTVFNTSKEIGAVSDFPPPAEYPVYMHHRKFCEYMDMIVEKFDLLKHIYFHHLVVKVQQAESYESTGRWTVTTHNTKTNEENTEEFDGVMVCTGRYVYPNIPSFPGQEIFKGIIKHTHSIKKADFFEDMNVAIVGVGDSGLDAAIDISRVAKTVYLSRRSGAWIFSRIGPREQPLDVTYLRRYLLRLSKIMPESIVSYFVKKEANKIFDHKKYGLEPEHGVLRSIPTFSETLPIKLLSKSVAVRENIKQFTEDGLVFENEQEETKVEAVVFATGYLITFPFLDEKIFDDKSNKILLYKYIYPPHLQHPTLAILGLVQPIGPLIALEEMQCRWTARVMSGRVKLPPKEEMYADIISKEKVGLRKPLAKSHRHSAVCDYVAYQDELAEMIGVKPNFWKIAVSDPKLFWALITGPFLPYQYRLEGPHCWDGAREAILTFGDRMKAPFKKTSDSSFEEPDKSLDVIQLLVLVVVIVYNIHYLYGKHIPIFV